MNAVRLTVAACALLAAAAVAGCGTGVPYSAAEQRAGSASVAPPPGTAAAPARFGEKRTLDNLVVAFSMPRSFIPSDNAYPHKARAVAFELTIENRGANPYRVSQLAVSATANGGGTEQVIDPVQGYTGIVSAGESIPAGQTTRVTLAFAMPEQRVDVTVTMQSNAAGGGGSCVFAGTG